MTKPATVILTGRSKRVLLMIRTAHTHGRSILEGIADYAEQLLHWQHYVVTDVHPKPILEGGVDGMIIEAFDDATLEAARNTKIPAITVANVLDREGPPGVVADNRAVGRMGANYLADLGLRNIAFAPSANALYSVHRLEGFREGAASRGVKCFVMDEHQTENESALAEWIRGLPDPVGMMGAHDRKALQVSRACRSAGRRIPEQVALLGVDNEAETCRLADPPLSSIDHGTRRIGYEAAKMLDGWMTTGQRPKESIYVQPIGVVSRQSSDLLAIDDPDVVAALRFIRSNAGEPLKVADVLKHVAMSRRSLEMHFQKAVSRTIHEEIMRVRIDRAKHLLITSDWSIVHIGDACGFSLPSQFSFAFRRETGNTPVQFRNQYRYRSSKELKPA